MRGLFLLFSFFISSPLCSIGAAEANDALCCFPRKLRQNELESVTPKKEQTMNKRFTEEQTIRVLKESDAGVKIIHHHLSKRF